MQRGFESRPGVIFDVDGTLVDSNYLHTIAWSRAFHDAGLHVDAYRIHRAIGMGSDQLLQTLVGEEREDLNEGHSRHMKSFRDDQRAFPKAAELLQHLSQRGALVAWATSAKPGEIGHLKQVVGAGEAVEHVTSSDDVERTKPSPDLFKVTLEACNLDPARTLAVGDSMWDVEAAGRCGIGCVGVLTGGTSSAELRGAGAIAVFVDVRELLGRLDASPLGQLLGG